MVVWQWNILDNIGAINGIQVQGYAVNSTSGTHFNKEMWLSLTKVVALLIYLKKCLILTV